MEFSQLAATGNVSGWARHLFLIRFHKEKYSSNNWNMKGYTSNYRGGISIGSDGARNFKLQLIM
jgi:hypothetical protein